MHLLMVTPNLPHQGGGANTRNYHLLKVLTSLHTVSLLALVDRSELANTSAVTQLEQLTHTLKIVERPPAVQSKRRQQFLRVLRGQSYTLQVNMLEEMQEALDTLLGNSTYDAVVFESVLIAGYHLPANIPVIIDQHNLEYEILERTYQLGKSKLRRWYNQRESQILKPIEIERCSKADIVLVTSEREQQILQSLLPQQLIVTVPNGVDTEMFQQRGNREEVSGRIVFTGAMNYYPNVNAVLFFAQHCWPLIQARVPDATWQIVGREPPAEISALARLPGVQVTGSVPDVRPYLTEAAVAVAPLQIGSGTRLKILEALAMGKAMVSTSIGCEGIAVVLGKHLLIADQPETFASAVVELLNDPTKRHKLGTAGRKLVETQYSWTQCSDRLLQQLKHLKERPRVC